MTCVTLLTSISFKEMIAFLLPVLVSSECADDYLVCSNIVAREYDQCISECPRGDAVCLTQCARSYDKDLSECPCQVRID